MWQLHNTTNPVAQKNYNCNASDFIHHSDYSEVDFSKEDWEIIKKAESEGWLILKGVEYVKTEGLWEGEWSTVRARKDLNEICMKYDLYQY